MRSNSFFSFNAMVAPIIYLFYHYRNLLLLIHRNLPDRTSHFPPEKRIRKRETLGVRKYRLECESAGLLSDLFMTF
ncbi:Hypothetical protein DEACI_0633 [Acididesulfobacillus acetoxydans]|uniref:Uncharacterized protein n=1 Tax=Acididesulfobacillus acetoxydans TaxID=1561005 RepID=A0A8S0WLF6_9FIRM|nr:Hypothetical protein DEACI_0633 [Acididesulfobacillus acetoxydans]CEJ05977.1 Hypothetical protein DEACI_0397 [Acididesulfobacillus acetoxydans]